MKCRIVGIERLDYTSKRTGKQVTGTRLHCINLDHKIDFGDSVENMYVKDTIDCDCFGIGDEVNVYYNRYGSVDDVRPA